MAAAWFEEGGGESLDYAVSKITAEPLEIGEQMKHRHEERIFSLDKAIRLNIHGSYLTKGVVLSPSPEKNIQRIIMDAQ